MTLDNIYAIGIRSIPMRYRFGLDNKVAGYRSIGDRTRALAVEARASTVASRVGAECGRGPSLLAPVLWSATRSRGGGRALNGRR